MELVCWVLLNEFDCIIEGGFVRDWIIRGHENWVPGTKLTKSDWNGKPDINDETISPKDLDVFM